MFIGTLSGKAESLSYVGNDGNYEHSQLTMLSGNTSLASKTQIINTVEYLEART